MARSAKDDRARKTGHVDGKSDTREESGEGHRTRDTVATMAHVLRHRDRIVSDALHLLESTGWLDPATRERAWGIYQRGDTRTRLAMQELVAHTIRVPLEKFESLDGLEEDDVDLEKIDEVDLERLKRLSIPAVDPERISRRLRELDVERFLKDDEAEEELGFFSKLLTEVPVKVNRLRLELLGAGVVLLLLVAASLVFPAFAQIILFYGLLVLTALLGVYLIRWSRKIDRLFKDADLELGVLVKLRPKERRLLILRRVWLRFVDTHRLADTLEHMLHSMVPDMFIDRDGDEPEASRTARAARARHKSERKTERKAERKAEREHEDVGGLGRAVRAREKAERRAARHERRAEATPSTPSAPRGTATKRTVRARVKRRTGKAGEE